MIQEQDRLRAILTKHTLSNAILKNLLTEKEKNLADGTIKYVGKSTIPGHTDDDIFLITTISEGRIEFYVEGGASMLSNESKIESPIDSRIKFIPEIASVVPVVSSSGTCTSCQISGGASRRRKAKRHGKQRRTRRRTYRRLGRRF